MILRAGAAGAAGAAAGALGAGVVCASAGAAAERAKRRGRNEQAAAIEVGAVSQDALRAIERSSTSCRFQPMASLPDDLIGRQTTLAPGAESSCGLAVLGKQKIENYCDISMTCSISRTSTPRDVQILERNFLRSMPSAFMRAHSVVRDTSRRSAASPSRPRVSISARSISIFSASPRASREDCYAATWPRRSERCPTSGSAAFAFRTAW